MREVAAKRGIKNQRSIQNKSKSWINRREESIVDNSDDQRLIVENKSNFKRIRTFGSWIANQESAFKVRRECSLRKRRHIRLFVRANRRDTQRTRIGVSSQVARCVDPVFSFTWLIIPLRGGGR